MRAQVCHAHPSMSPLFDRDQVTLRKTHTHAAGESFVVRGKTRADQSAHGRSAVVSYSLWENMQ